jgi:predicted dinucleotide-binding enzyme
MEPSSVQVVVAADNEPFRARVAQILQRAGIMPVVVGPSGKAYHLTPDQWNHASLSSNG